MPKVIVSGPKGLVQSSGSGFGHAASDGGVGVYQFVKEVDLGGISAPTANTNLQHLRSVCTLPASSVVLRAYIMCSEACSAVASTLVDLAAIEDDVDTLFETTATNPIEIITDADINGAAIGDHFSIATTQAAPKDIANAVNILLRTGATVPATALTTGKFVIFIEYIGTGPAVNLATLNA